MLGASSVEAADYIHARLNELAQIAQRSELESVARLIQMAALEAQLQRALRKHRMH
jgi:hypothetical protein